ncbi:MAG: hypothetical protein K0R06_3568 [Clostridium sp.]|nr:hypothetical protein [Clostridium sp.]
MNETLKIIKERRSVRVFKNDKLKIKNYKLF